MSTHRALFKTSQGTFQVGRKPIPFPGKGEILVRVVAAASNPADWKMGPLVQTFPVVLGLDGARVIEEIGDAVTEFKKGDNV